MATTRNSQPTVLVPLHFGQGDSHVVIDGSQLPFRTLGRLGDGSFGTVEKVANADGVAYARKILSFHPTKDRIEKEKIFHREVDIIKSLSKHHHIVQVFATYITLTEFALLLFPVADGGNLNDFLSVYWDEQHRFWSTRTMTETWKAMRQEIQRSFGCLASGLAFMHKRKIRHRDISPRNILVHEGRIVYADFGYSLDHSELSNSHSTGKPEAYTPKYAAPEVRDWELRGPESDVYSLGCVFVDLFSAYLGREELSLPGVPEEEASRFNEIRRVTRETGLQQPYLALAKLILDMTQQVQTDRPEAEEALNVILELPGFCCSLCQSTLDTTIDCPSNEEFFEQRRWLWSEQHQDYFYVTVDDQGRGSPWSVWDNCIDPYVGQYAYHWSKTVVRAGRGKFWTIGRVFKIVWREDTPQAPTTEQTFVVLRVEDSFVRAWYVCIAVNQRG